MVTRAHAVKIGIRLICPQPAGCSKLIRSRSVRKDDEVSRLRQPSGGLFRHAVWESTVWRTAKQLAQHAARPAKCLGYPTQTAVSKAFNAFPWQLCRQARSANIHLETLGQGTRLAASSGPPRTFLFPDYSAILFELTDKGQLPGIQRRDFDVKTT